MGFPLPSSLSHACRHDACGVSEYCGTAGMKKWSVFLFLVAAFNAQAADEHAGHAGQAAAANDVAVSASSDAAMAEARHMNMMMHGETLNTYILANRFELVRDNGADTLEWDIQGWAGRDINKFWFKTEGSYDTDTNHADDLEVQALYSRAVAPFWDVQVGVRQQNGFGPSRTYAVFGLQGLAPYWFELDAAAFVS